MIFRISIIRFQCTELESDLDAMVLVRMRAITKQNGGCLLLTKSRSETEKSL